MNPISRHALVNRDRSNLTDKVTKALLEEIVSRKYAVGHVLPSEQNMAESFGVSRTVLREAVSRLKAEGILDSRQGIGVIVRSNRRLSFRLKLLEPDSTEEIVKIVELRMGIETEAAALAAMRRDDDDIARLTRYLGEMAEAIESNDLDRGVEADLEFHRSIYAATKNPHYASLFDYLSQFFYQNITVSRTRSAEQDRRRYRAQAEHEEVCNAITAGQPELAREKVRTLLMNTAERLSTSD